MVIRQRSVKLNCQNFKKARFPRQFAISFRKQNENNCQERESGLESSQMAPNEDFFQVILAQSGQGGMGRFLCAQRINWDWLRAAPPLPSRCRFKLRLRKVNELPPPRELEATFFNRDRSQLSFSGSVCRRISPLLASSGLEPSENTSTSRGRVAWVRGGVLLRCRIFFGDGKGG